MRRNHSLLGILTTAVMCASMLPVSANAGEKFQLNGGGQRKGAADGYSYELWIDKHADREEPADGTSNCA